MEYEKEQNYNREEMTNYARIVGRVCSEPVFSHQVEGENFYELKVEVERLSKSIDIIPVTISDRTLIGKELKNGDTVEFMGEYRSYNKLLNEKSKLILHLFAKEAVAQVENAEHVNEVKLVGYICKEPIYRKTPFEREICDVLLAVNRVNNHKSDYVPCIMWGRNARFMANQKIGCKVELTGRIQSREYTKNYENGKIEQKTAYEVSCQRIALLSNITELNSNKDREERVVN